MFLAFIHSSCINNDQLSKFEGLHINKSDTKAKTIIVKEYRRVWLNKLNILCIVHVQVTLQLFE